MPTSSEAMLISAIVTSRDAVTHVHRGISSIHFHIYTEEWAWVEQYITAHDRAPSVSALRQEYPEFPYRRTDDVAHYCDRVKTQHARFLFNNMVSDAVTMSQTNMESALGMLTSGVTSVYAALDGHGGSVSLNQTHDLQLAEYEAAKRTVGSTRMPGIPSGFSTLDTATGGFRSGDYVIVGARLSHAKTWTLISMARDAVLSGKSALFVTMEMSEQLIRHRLYCLLSSDIGPRPISLSALKFIQLPTIELRRFLKDFADRTDTGEIHVLDKSRKRITVTSLAAEIERIKPEIVFVDYLTLLDTRDKDWVAVAKLSNDIQGLAARYRIPVVAAAQVNRLGEGKQPPSASQISLSDSIGQDADIVVTQVLQSRSVIKSRLAKHRNGESQLLWFTELNPDRGVYREITGDKAARLIEDDAAED